MSDEINKAQLMSIVERLENNDEEKKSLAEDRKSILENAKEFGLEPKYCQYVVKLRAQDREERMIEEANREAYRLAAGIE